MKPAAPSVSFPEVENAVLDKWDREKTFYRSNEMRRGGKEFVFYDGPPFANGLPHYGHLLANTVKDSVPRYWSMRGYFVDRRFGWDCHGFPVECEIEKKEGLSGRPDILKMGIATFNEKCRTSVTHYTKEWQRTITRLGRWVDWQNQYRTMDLSFMETVWWVLQQLHKKSLFYRGHYVVAYSPKLSAVLSNFEANQNYKDVQDPALTVMFKAADEDAYFVAWTTTPWTLISNLALAVGPKIPYVKIKHQPSGRVLYMAKERAAAMLNESEYEIISELNGSELKGRSYLPLFQHFKNQANAFKVLADDFVSTSEGTGIVHMAPAYGEDDFRICRSAGIELVDPLDDEACFTARVPEYQGKFVKDADKLIIKDLKDAGAVLKHDVIVHSYPHCERTEGPLIYRAIPAWYVKVEVLKEQLVRNNQTINWVPEHLRDGRMGKWLENARDWAISRNRFWGTPLPVWICNKDDSHMDVHGSVAELEKLSGAKIQDLHKHFIDEITYKCSKCAGEMKRVPEVFDCWFESGAMPYAQMHYPFENRERFESHFPADFIAEGLDQTRGWFYTLSILSAALFNRPAFKNVVVNGLVLAKDGKKMSKRLGNYTPPEDLLNKYGADSARLYMLNSPILKAEPLRFSDEGVRDTTRAVLLPYWNAYSFLSTYAAAEGWSPSQEAASGKAPTVSNPLDRWIISRLQSVLAGVHGQMESYRLYAVVPEVLSFIDELTNWYIRLSRRRFWNTDSTGQLSSESRTAFETLYYVLLQFSKLFAPFAPFVTERVYGGLTEGLNSVEESVHLCDMPMQQAELIDEELERHMRLVSKLTGLGRGIRAKQQIKTRQVLKSMTVITTDEPDRECIKRYSDILREELNVKEIHFSTDESQSVRVELKPNLKILGKKLGKDLGELRNALTLVNANQTVAHQLVRDADGGKQLKVDRFELEKDEVLIDRHPLEGTVSASEGTVTVVFDAHLTEELILEGLAREMVNRIQSLRKDSNLNVSDRIRVELAGSEQVLKAAKAFETYIGNETLTTNLSLKSDKAGLTGKILGDFDLDGEALSVAIEVVGV
jgi:isoleucyl-tRNA synthetase